METGLKTLLQREQNLLLYPNCDSTLPGKSQNDRKTAHFEVNHISAFDRTGCSQLSQKIVQCSSFPILGRKFSYQSSVRKSFTFPRVFDKKFRPIFKLKKKIILRSNSRPMT